MNDPERDAALDRDLASWRLNPPRNPGFRAAVHARLEDPAAETWTHFLRRHAAAVGTAGLLALLAGSWIGWEGAVARADADRAALVRSYVQSLDARAMALDLLP